MPRRVASIWALVYLLMASAGPALAQTSITDVVKRVKPAVVTVTTYSASGDKIAQGSGFFVDSSHVVTCWHVIDEGYRAEVKAADGKTYNVRGIAAADRQSDLVSLALDKPNTAVTPLHVVKKLPLEGERVVVIGGPRGLEYTISDGIASSVRQVPGLGTVVQISAPISVGSSGSPVVNLDGEVVGVAKATLVEGQNLNFAIPGEKVLALTPGSVQPLPGKTGSSYSESDASFVKGFNLFKAGEYSKALTYLQDSVKKDPKKSYGWLLIGYCYLELDRIQDAKGAFKQAITVQPDFADAYYGLGVSEMGLGSNERAIAAFKQAVRIDPAYGLGHFGLGIMYVVTGDRTSALQEYNVLKTLDPDLATKLFGYIYQ